MNSIAGVAMFQIVHLRFISGAASEPLIVTHIKVRCYHFCSTLIVVIPMRTDYCITIAGVSSLSLSRSLLRVPPRWHLSVRVNQKKFKDVHFRKKHRGVNARSAYHLLERC
jgi:hypothetical protein